MVANYDEGSEYNTPDGNICDLFTNFSQCSHIIIPPGVFLLFIYTMIWSKAPLNSHSASFSSGKWQLLRFFSTSLFTNGVAG